MAQINHMNYLKLIKFNKMITIQSLIKNIQIRILVKSAVVIVTSFIGTLCFADNPIIQTNYTADPAPMVYNDTVFLYTSHDEDNAFGFAMVNWMLYTSTDIVNWTDHPDNCRCETAIQNISWADGHSAWAPQCIARNGKFYLYCPTIHQGKMAIGVAVSDSPYGPFVDAIGKPLVYRSNPGDYDPSVFIDDDARLPDGQGRAHVLWGGNGPCYYARLNEDMISLAGEIQVASIDLQELHPRHRTLKARGCGKRTTITTWHGHRVAVRKV